MKRQVKCKCGESIEELQPQVKCKCGAKQDAGVEQWCRSRRSTTWE
jgi:hypothetical protein